MMMKNGFIWSTLARLHPCNENHPNRVSNCQQYFDDLDIKFRFLKRIEVL